MSRISKTAFAFYIEDFKGARDKDVKEIKDIVYFAADLKLKDLRIDDDPYFEGTFIDDDETLEVIIDENTNLILDLIDKTDFSYLGRIGFVNKLELKIEQPEVKMKIDKIVFFTFVTLKNGQRQERSNRVKICERKCIFYNKFRRKKRTKDKGIK